MISSCLLYVFAFLMAVFYRVFSYISIAAPIPGGKIYVTELLIAFFIIVGLIKLSILKKLRRWIILNQKIMICYLFFSMSSITALCYSNRSSAALVIREFASYYYSFFFFFPIFIFKNEKKQDILVRVILLATLFAYLLITYRAIMGLGHINSTGEYRYGSYETIGVIILLSSLFSKPFEQWNFSYWLILLLSIIITLVFINHRSAVIALVASISIVNYLNNRNKLFEVLKNLWIGCLILCILSLPFFLLYRNAFYSSFERLLSIFSPTEEANSAWRLFTWKIIFSDMNIYNWLIGHGWGWQIPIFEFNDRVYGAAGEIRGFHNSFLFYLYHIGLLGLGLFFLFVISVYKNAIRLIKNCSTEIRQKVNSLIAANIGILVFSLFNVVLEGPYMSFFFWISLGLIYNYPNLYLYNQSIIVEEYKK